MRWRVRAQGCARFSCRGGRADGAETRRRPARDPDGRRRPEKRGPRARLHPSGGPRGRATRRAARDLSRSLHRAGGLLAPRDARRGRARGEGLRRRRRDRVRAPGRHRARPLLQLSLPLRADGRAARDVPAHDAAGPLDLRGREVLGLQVPGGGRAARVRHRVRQARLVNVQRGVRAGAGARHGAQGRRHHAPARRTLELRAPRHVAHAPLGARDREPHDHRHEPQHPAGPGRARDLLHSRRDPAGGTPAGRLHRDRRPRARPVAPRAGGPPRRPVALADEARHLQAMAPSRGVSGGSAMNDARPGRLGRRDFLTGTAALALAFPCGAGAQPQGGTLTYASTALPPNIEPHMQGLDIWQQRKPLIYENLIWVDESLEAKPELAERWEQRSPTEYVFRLRRGVRFHGGKELDAEDVKYTYDRVRDPKVSPGANDLLVIKQIDVLDAHTVRFVLHAPAATFLINLGGKYNGVIPKGAAGDGRELLTRAIGTGPFGVEQFDPSRRLVLKRHAAYWGPTKPALEGIVFQAIPDESSIVAGLRTGQVTMAQFSSALSFQVARSVATLQTIQAPSTRWVVLDLAGDTEPTSKPEVRQAIALALDRQAILQIAGGGLGQRLGVLPPGMKAWAMPWQELPNQQRDLARARALLPKAGYPGRVAMTIRNIVGFPALAAALPVIVDNLREASIDVRVETVDGGVWIKDWIVPQSPPTMNEWGGFVDPDQAFHRHFHSAPGGKDFRRWNNKKADELLDAGRATLERAKRKRPSPAAHGGGSDHHPALLARPSLRYAEARQGLRAAPDGLPLRPALGVALRRVVPRLDACLPSPASRRHDPHAPRREPAHLRDDPVGSGHGRGTAPRPGRDRGARGARPVPSLLRARPSRPRAVPRLARRGPSGRLRRLLALRPSGAGVVPRARTRLGRAGGAGGGLVARDRHSARHGLGGVAWRCARRRDPRDRHARSLPACLLAGDRVDPALLDLPRLDAVAPVGAVHARPVRQSVADGAAGAHAGDGDGGDDHPHVALDDARRPRTRVRPHGPRQGAARAPGDPPPRAP